MIPCPAPLADAESLRIGGLERFSAVDWPGQLAAVVFCQGCGWRCRYCHNPHLVPFATTDAWHWPDILRWLERRRGLLDAVVFSGGEPTLQPGLPAAAQAARALGFKIGLHTGGPLPGNLDALIPFLDWVGFDLKAPFPAYEKITGLDHGDRARTSMEMLLSARIPCEVRTTWHPRLLSTADLAQMAGSLVDAGCTEWTIQRFRPDGCRDEELRCASVGEVPLAAISVPGLAIHVR